MDTILGGDEQGKSSAWPQEGKQTLAFGNGSGQRSYQERYQDLGKEIVQHPLSSWGFLSPQCEKAEAHGYLHSSHSTNKVSLRFISSRKVLGNIKGIGICSLRTHPADPSLAEERLQGLIYPIVDD